MTTVKIKQLALSLLLVAVVLPAAAQVSDLQSWHCVKVGGDLTKDLSLSVEQQVRLFDNSTRVDQTFTEIDLGYDLPKGFELDLAYRFSWNQERGGYFSNRHRYNLDISYSEKFWRLKGKVRARFQHRPSPSLFNERFEPDDSPLVARLKAGVDVRKLGDWTPSIEFEAFFRLDNPIERGFTTMRYRVSLDYDLPKRMDLGIFYMLETEYSGQTPAYISVVGINYAYEWKRPKKKKKKDKDKK
jgi:hypothetical protein